MLIRTRKTITNKGKPMKRCEIQVNRKEIKKKKFVLAIQKEEIKSKAVKEKVKSNGQKKGTRRMKIKKELS